MFAIFVTEKNFISHNVTSALKDVLQDRRYPDQDRLPVKDSEVLKALYLS